MLLGGRFERRWCRGWNIGRGSWSPPRSFRRLRDLRADFADFAVGRFLFDRKVRFPCGLRFRGLWLVRLRLFRFLRHMGLYGLDKQIRSEGFIQEPNHI